MEVVRETTMVPGGSKADQEVLRDADLCQPEEKGMQGMGSVPGSPDTQ